MDYFSPLDERVDAISSPKPRRLGFGVNQNQYDFIASNPYAGRGAGWIDMSKRVMDYNMTQVPHPYENSNGSTVWKPYSQWGNTNIKDWGIEVPESQPDVNKLSLLLERDQTLDRLLESPKPISGWSDPFADLSYNTGKYVPLYEGPRNEGSTGFHVTDDFYDPRPSTVNDQFGDGTVVTGYGGVRVGQPGAADEFVNSLDSPDKYLSLVEQRNLMQYADSQQPEFQSWISSRSQESKQPFRSLGEALNAFYSNNSKVSPVSKNQELKAKALSAEVPYVVNSNEDIKQFVPGWNTYESYSYLPYQDESRESFDKRMSEVSKWGWSDSMPGGKAANMADSYARSLRESAKSWSNVLSGNYTDEDLSLIDEAGRSDSSKKYGGQYIPGQMEGRKAAAWMAGAISDQEYRDPQFNMTQLYLKYLPQDKNSQSLLQSQRDGGNGVDFYSGGGQIMELERALESYGPGKTYSGKLKAEIELAKQLRDNPVYDQARISEFKSLYGGKNSTEDEIFAQYLGYAGQIPSSAWGTGNHFIKASEWRPEFGLIQPSPATGVTK